MKHNINKFGFTIIELMISSAVFSVVLLICLTAITRVGKMYYKGATSAQTQQVARTILDEISQGIQFNNSSIKHQESESPYPYFCIGGTRYTYVVDKMQASVADVGWKTRHAMWADKPPDGCGGLAYNPPPSIDLNAVSPSSNGYDMLANNMSITSIKLSAIDSSGTTWKIQVAVAFGDQDLFEVVGDKKLCKGGVGSEFCSTSELSTIVKKRVQ